MICGELVEDRFSDRKVYSMGSSPRGILFFGVQLSRDEEDLPWDSEEFDGDEDSWWRNINGFVNPVDDPFDDLGNYRPGYFQNDPRVGEYFDAQRKWEEEHPFPFELVRLGYCDEPEYALAVKGQTKEAEWSECVEINHDSLLPMENEAEALIAFCNAHSIEIVEEKVGWFLSSFYG